MTQSPTRKEQLSQWVTCTTRAAYDELGGDDTEIHFDVPACRKPRCEARGNVCVLRVQRVESKDEDWQVWHETCLMEYIQSLDEKQRLRMSSVNEAALRKCAVTGVFKRPTTNSILRLWPESRVTFLACAAASQSDIVPQAIAYSNGDRVHADDLPLNLMFTVQADLPLSSGTNKLPNLAEGIPHWRDGSVAVIATRLRLKYNDADGDERQHCIVFVTLAYQEGSGSASFEHVYNRLQRTARRSTPELLRSNVFDSDAELTQLHHSIAVYVARMTGSVDHARVEQALSFANVHMDKTGRGTAYLRCTPGSQERFLVGKEGDAWLVKPSPRSMLVPFMPTAREVQEGRGTDFDILVTIPAREVLRESVQSM